MKSPDAQHQGFFVVKLLYRNPMVFCVAECSATIVDITGVFAGIDYGIIKGYVVDRQ